LADTGAQADCQRAGRELFDFGDAGGPFGPAVDVAPDAQTVSGGAWISMLWVKIKWSNAINGRNKREEGRGGNGTNGPVAAKEG